MKKEIKVKKVPAFPFPIKLVGPGGEHKAQVVKAGKNGLILDLVGLTLKVSDRYQVSFDLPVLKKHIEETAVVVKIYSKFSESLETGQLAELHFVTFSDSNRQVFNQFLAAAQSLG